MHYFPAPVTTFLQQQLPVLHQRPPSCCSNYLLAPSAPGPAPATTFVHQQLTILHQRPHSCTCSYNSCTSDYRPAPAASSPATAATSPARMTTSPDYQTYTSNPVLHQRLDPASTNSYWIFWTGIHPTIFRLRFAIIKFVLSKQPPCFSFLPCSLSITYISQVCGIDIFIGLETLLSLFWLGVVVPVCVISMG